MFISPVTTYREFCGEQLDEQQEEEPVEEHVFFKNEIAAEMNFDPELRSNNLVFGIPMDLHEEDIKEIQDSVSGKLTLGGYIEVDPSKALKESTASSIIRSTTETLIQSWRMRDIYRNLACQLNRAKYLVSALN